MRARGSGQGAGAGRGRGPGGGGREASTRWGLPSHSSKAGSLMSRLGSDSCKSVSRFSSEGLAGPEIQPADEVARARGERRNGGVARPEYSHEVQAADADRFKGCLGEHSSVIDRGSRELETHCSVGRIEWARARASSGEA